MKTHDTNLFQLVTKFKWNIETFELEKDPPRNAPPTIYEVGDHLNFNSSTPEMYDEVILHKYKAGEDLTLPFFMCIKPTWYIRDDVLYIVFIVANSACELHRFIIWFENLDSNKPTFKFIVANIYDDCTCDDKGNGRVLFSGHGIGGGTGDPD